MPPTMSRRRWTCTLAAAALAFGCEPAEVGSIGPETRAGDSLPTGPEPSQVKGKDKPKSRMETRASRK